MGLGACQSCQDVGDGVDYYFRNLERILDPSYIPTTLDILNTRLILYYTMSLSDIHSFFYPVLKPLEW